ncbi:MAG TPA: hypothetical protein VLD83_17240 [Candidatus Binatia bacterium]|nr:hypothetical protein [Candidatus Binatia bacterium]
MSHAFIIRYDPKLIEEAVFHAQRDSCIAKVLDERRSRIYEIADPDEREQLFNDLYRSWFVRLGLGKVVDQALQEQPIIRTHVGSCYVVCATQANEESAELFVAPDRGLDENQRRTLRVLIRPGLLLQQETAITFLRHELFHIADMLDPAFAYEPALPKADGGPTHDSLITNRYRVLWDVTISGRMVRRGWISESIRDEQLRVFRYTFSMPEEKSRELFSRFFDGERPTHLELATFAFDPRAAIRSPNGASTPGTHCPLCRFPTHAFEPEPENLGNEVISTIRRDFPQWAPALGLCAQCADLYRANQLSIAAANELPGWH